MELKKKNTHFSTQQLLPLGLEKINNALARAIKGDGSYQQSHHNHVGKKSQKIRKLSRALNAFRRYCKTDSPTQKQEDGQLPIGKADAIVDAVLLLYHFSPARAKIKKRREKRWPKCDLREPKFGRRNCVSVRYVRRIYALRRQAMYHFRVPFRFAMGPRQVRRQRVK